MSDIQICIKDRDDECEWRDIDEDLLDLSVHDAKLRNEVIDEIYSAWVDWNSGKIDTEYFDDVIDQLKGE